MTVEDAPQFTKRPEDAEIIIGDLVTFVAEINSKTPVKVDWKKGEEVLSRGKRIEMSENENIFTLKIANATIDDEGFYKCIARNDAGKNEYEFELLVEGRCFFNTQ